MAANFFIGLVPARFISNESGSDPDSGSVSDPDPDGHYFGNSKYTAVAIESLLPRCVFTYLVVALLAIGR